MTMPEDFVFWIKSIVEDDPIPYEIEHIYFALSLKNKISSLSLGGRELETEIIGNFEYYPLEAQFFFNQTFNNITDPYLAKLAVKELLDYALKDSEIKKIFKNKKLYIGEFQKSPEYKISV